MRRPIADGILRGQTDSAARGTTMSDRRTLVWLFELGPGKGLRARIFRAMTLVAAGLCLLLIVPVNAALGLTPVVNAAVAVFGAVCLGLHALARAGRPLPALFCVLVVFLLDAVWLLTGGSLGSAVMWFYFVAFLLTLFFRGGVRVAVLGALVLNVLALYGLEVARPDLVVPYASAEERTADVATAFPLSALACALLMWVILDAYDQERRHLRESNRTLERTLAELKTLRGLLPVCSWCHRIRDEAGAWSDVSTYVTERTEAKVTHGICPDCAERHFPQA